MTTEKKIVVYEHADFQGRSKKLRPGKYNIIDLYIGFLNDTISSLKVPEDMKVTLYEHSDFSGRKKTFLEDNAYVGDDFNDKTSSILVELVATIYEHSDYQGRSQKLSPGRYNIGDLVIGNDSLSSLKVPEGLKVTLYEHADFSGRTKTLMENSTYVGDDFNDKTSSILVESVAPVYEYPELAATVYEHSDYQGRSQNLILGEYNIGDLVIGNDAISSLKVPEGLKVTLYEHADFSGRTKTFMENSTYVGDDFNDKTSSILVELVATIYEHSNYQGRSKKLGPGRYDMNDLGIGNDSLSSLKVPEGLKVTLYEHANFTGRTKTFMENSTYVGDDFNDKTSSIKVDIVP